MQMVGYLIVLILIRITNSHESDSAEINRIEISPFYDTIIFSDVIDIINELNKNLNSPFDDNSESDSDENIEDLLTEYQHYLDKAHEQRRIYLEKSNTTKNKVPLLRHENFVKTSVPTDYKYSSYYAHNYYNPSIIKFPPMTLNKPLDLFVPINPTMSYFNKPDRVNGPQRKDYKEKSFAYDKTGQEERSLFYFPSSLQKSISVPLKSSCFCKPNEFPCKCNCKQCLLSFNENGEKFINTDSNKNIFPSNPLVGEPKLNENIMENMMNIGNVLNVRIKVDVQIPNIPDVTKINKYIRYDSGAEFDDLSRESRSSFRLPSTYFNFTVPMDLLGFKKFSKINKHESPLHKITIHKKKKSKSGSNNKKHRKKLITFHNIKLSPTHTLKPKVVENHNTSNVTIKNEYTFMNAIHRENETVTNTTMNVVFTNFTTPSTDIPIALNTTHVEESIYFMVNISNNNDNETDDVQKTGNSIELEYKTITNTTTETLRKKRDTTSQNSSIIMKKISSKLPNIDGNKSKIALYALKKTNRSILPDFELLYWPNNAHNQSIKQIKDITNIILEQENKKAKVNMSKEAIRHNRTAALEKAIFGNVDWNDVDTVAPTFLSFVGKYITGTLTFCSEKICHSMKCGNKSCVHRTCIPELRFNHYGHCSGCNKTDSVVSMESIMDLPSNVVFEIVDILQDKMLGKLYGKVTLCINSKCSSFIASKKTFIKFKCSAKNLNNSGHCPGIKKS